MSLLKAINPQQVASGKAMEAKKQQKKGEGTAVSNHPFTMDEERALIKKAKADDLQAYSQLIDAYQNRVYQLIYNMTGNKEDTEDLVQEVFVKGFQALKRFKGKARFYTWLYRIAVNRTINFVKKRNRRSSLSLNEVDHGVERDEVYVELSSKQSPFRDTTLNELQMRLNKALQTLSEKHRAVVVMHDIQGLPHDEIAEIIGVSSGTVRSRLFYARQLLQAELQDLRP